MLNRFTRLRRDEFGIDTEEYEQLAREVVRWRERAVELFRERQIGQEHERDHGREL